MTPPGFWKSVAGVCSGTAVFDVLRRNSWGRVIWHFLLWSAIVSLLTAFFQIRYNSLDWERLTTSLEKAFGENIIFSPGKIIPEKSPGQYGARLALPWGGELEYQDSVSHHVMPEMGTAAYRIIWNPASLTFQFSQDDVMILDLLAPEENVTELVMTQIIDGNKSEHPFSGVKIPHQEEKVSWSMLSMNLKLHWFLTAFLVQWFWSVFLAVIYPAVFVGVSRLTGAGQLRRLSIREYWKIGIYAGFPALLIAGCFPAFGLPYFSFETVFVVAMLIYWMYVTIHLESSSEKGKENERE